MTDIRHLVAAALGEAAEFAIPPEETRPIHRGSYDSGTDIIEHGGFYTGNMGDYYWRAEARPRTHVFPEVSDTWNLSGYGGTIVEMRKHDDSVLEAPRRYVLRYKFSQLGGGPGGSG